MTSLAHCDVTKSCLDGINRSQDTRRLSRTPGCTGQWCPTSPVILIYSKTTPTVSSLKIWNTFPLMTPLWLVYHVQTILCYLIVKTGITAYLNKLLEYPTKWRLVMHMSKSRCMVITKHMYSIPREICTRFCCTLLCCGYAIVRNEVFIHIHEGCFAGTGAIVRLPQCKWSKPDGYGKISQCITTTKHSKAKTVCIFLGIYCIKLSGSFSITKYRSNWLGQKC